MVAKARACVDTKQGSIRLGRTGLFAVVRISTPASIPTSATDLHVCEEEVCLIDVRNGHGPTPISILLKTGDCVYVLQSQDDRRHSDVCACLKGVRSTDR